MRTIISRKSRVIADTDAYPSLPVLVQHVRSGATVTHNGDAITTRETTPQGHELISHRVVRHDPDGSIHVRNLGDDQLVPRGR